MRAKQMPEAITHQIVSKVAEAKGVSPMDLRPLTEVLDPDSVEKIFSSDSEVELRFKYEGYTLLVEGQGEVSLE